MKQQEPHLATGSWINIWIICCQWVLHSVSSYIPREGARASEEKQTLGRQPALHHPRLPAPGPARLCSSSSLAGAKGRRQDQDPGARVQAHLPTLQMTSGQPCSMGTVRVPALLWPVCVESFLHGTACSRHSIHWSFLLQSSYCSESSEAVVFSIVTDSCHRHKRTFSSPQRNPAPVSNPSTLCPHPAPRIHSCVLCP